MDFAEELTQRIPRLKAFAFSIIGSAQDVPDLVQDVLRIAWEKQSQFKPGTNLNGWLYMIMLNHARSQWRRSKLALPEQNLVIDSPQEARVHTLDMLDHLATLPEDQQESLLLVALGHQYDEIGAMLAVPDGTVKSRVSRARSALNDRMNV